MRKRPPNASTRSERPLSTVLMLIVHGPADAPPSWSRSPIGSRPRRATCTCSKPQQRARTHRWSICWLLRLGPRSSAASRNRTRRRNRSNPERVPGHCLRRTRPGWRYNSAARPQGDGAQAPLEAAWNYLRSSRRGGALVSGGQWVLPAQRLAHPSRRVDRAFPCRSGAGQSPIPADPVGHRLDLAGINADASLRRLAGRGGAG